MATPRQLAANRRNARQSSGPKTLAGKAIARLNALQHGVFAAAPLLPGEDASAFAQLRQSYENLYRPSNPAERFLVGRIILAAWRLNRLAAMEVRVLAAHHADAEDRASLNQDILTLIALLFSGHSHAHAPNQTTPHQFESALPAHVDSCETGSSSNSWDNRQLGLGERDHVAHAYIRDSQHGNTVFKFAHYQTSLERSYYRAVHELERLRSMGAAPVTTNH